MENVDQASPSQLDRTQPQRIKKPFGGEQVRGLNVEEAGEAASGWVTLSSECILRSTLTHHAEGRWVPIFKCIKRANSAVFSRREKTAEKSCRLTQKQAWQPHGAQHFSAEIVGCLKLRR